MKRISKAPLLWLWHHHRGCRSKAIVNMLTGLLQVALGLLAVDTLRGLTDIATGAQEGSLVRSAVTLALIYAAEVLVHVVATWVSAVLGVQSENMMQSYFFRHTLREEWKGVESLHSGDLVNRLFSDVADIVRLMTEVTPSAVVVIVQFVASFAYLYIMDHTMAVVLIAASPVLFLLSRVYYKHMHRIVRRIKRTHSSMQAIIQEGIQRAMIVKAFSREEEVMADLFRQQRLAVRQTKARARLSIVSKVFVNVGFTGAFLVGLTWGLFQLQAGAITVGVLIAFTQLINRIQRPLIDMARLLPVFVNSMASAERLMELEAHPLEPSESPLPVSGSVGIRLSDVCYSYPKSDNGKYSGRVVLQNFSHDFRPGTFTAVIGETGAGKTTLIRMMLALIRPVSGKVTIYNDTVEYEIAPNLRCNFSYIPQGNTLFSGTIRQNLLQGRPDATDEELREALRDAKAEFVFRLPRGLDALCGENGVGLSEGQAQRIAIARAMLRPCRVLLLDEATSALDPETELELLANIKRRMQHTTIIFVTHRQAVTAFTTDVLSIKSAR